MCSLDEYQETVLKIIFKKMFFALCCFMHFYAVCTLLCTGTMSEGAQAQQQMAGEYYRSLLQGQPTPLLLPFFPCHIPTVSLSNTLIHGSFQTCVYEMVQLVHHL